MERIRSEGGGVVLVEFHQGAFEVRGIGVRGGIGVGFEFMATRKAAEEGLEKEGEDGHDQHKENQRSGRALTGDAQPVVKPGSIDELSECPEQA